MKTRLQCLAYALSMLALAACNQSGSGSGATTATTAAKPAAAPAAVLPYTYPAPVSGKYSEVNSGKFDLVDGIAYAADKGAAIYVTEKAIASPILAGSACAITQARALTYLRNSSFIEVRLDASGNATYYEAGRHFGGRRIDRAGRSAKVSGGKVKDGRVTGSVTDKGHAQFDFDLAVTNPGTSSMPTEAQLIAAYKEIRRAARARDLAAMLAAQGFDAKQIDAIRRLPGMDADFAAHADRFFDPGAPEETTLKPGSIYVGAKGKNSQGKAFFNFYWFTPCGEKLVLLGVAENPQ